MPVSLATLWEHTIEAVCASGNATAFEFEWAGSQGRRLHVARLAPERDAGGQIDNVLAVG